jgi:hypothetical protein
MTEQKASPQQLLDLLYSVALEAVVPGKRTLMAQLAYAQLSEILKPSPSEEKQPIQN